MVVEIINRRLFYNQTGRKFRKRSFHCIIGHERDEGDEEDEGELLNKFLPIPHSLFPIPED